MAFGGLDHQHTSQPMADINMTPLIDVMLVLLVIFIITAPLLTHAIRLDLPKVAAAPARETPETITVSIDAAGKLYWNDAPGAPDARAGASRLNADALTSIRRWPGNARGGSNSAYVGRSPARCTTAAFIDAPCSSGAAGSRDRRASRISDAPATARAHAHGKRCAAGADHPAARGIARCIRGKPARRAAPRAPYPPDVNAVSPCALCPSPV